METNRSKILTGENQNPTYDELNSSDEDSRKFGFFKPVACSIVLQAALITYAAASGLGIFDWLLKGNIDGDDDGSVSDAIKNNQVKKVGDDLYSVKTGGGTRKLIRRDEDGNYRASPEMSHDEYERTINKVKSGKRFKLW